MLLQLAHGGKQNQTEHVNSASIFEEILVFSAIPQEYKTVAREYIFALRSRFKMIFYFYLTMCTEKNGSVTTLGTLGRG